MTHDNVDEIYSKSQISHLLPLQRRFAAQDVRTYQAIGASLFEAYMLGAKDVFAAVKRTAQEVIPQ